MTPSSSLDGREHVHFMFRASAREKATHRLPAGVNIKSKGLARGRQHSGRSDFSEVGHACKSILPNTTRRPDPGGLGFVFPWCWNGHRWVRFLPGQSMPSLGSFFPRSAEDVIGFVFPARSDRRGTWVRFSRDARARSLGTGRGHRVGFVCPGRHPGARSDLVFGFSSCPSPSRAGV